MRDALGSVQSLLVLGGTSDIGAEIARVLVADRVRRVVLAVRDADRAAPLADELRDRGADVDVLHFDTDAVEDHEELVAKAFAGGDLDVVVLAAGVLGLGAEDDRAAAVDVLRTNVLGAVSVLVPVAQQLKEQGHGTLVVLSSVAGERVRKSNFVYGASKAAVDGFALGLGDALAGSGVDVMVVRPGFVETKMTKGMKPAPLATTPQAVAAAVVKGIRQRSAVIWVPAPLRWVMAVVRHLPRPVFRRLPF